MATVSPSDLVEAKTICLVLKLGRFGNTAKASMAEVQVDADKTLLRLSKQLLDSPELVAVAQFDGRLTKQIRALAFKSLFKGGVYLLPLSAVTTVTDRLNVAEPERNALVEAACEAYALRRDETLSRLGVEANMKDYPSVNRFRSRFYMEYSLVEFATPSRLQAIDSAVFQAEVQKQRARLAAVAEECQQTMRMGLLQVVEHLRDRLTPTEEGTRKALHVTAVGHLNDFLKTFELRNVTDDAELGALVQQARALMTGVTRKQLVTDEAFRLAVAEKLDGLAGALDPLITDKGRAITFEDDV